MNIKQPLRTAFALLLCLSLSQCDRSTTSSEQVAPVDVNNVSEEAATKVAISFWKTFASLNGKIGAESYSIPSSLAVKKVTEYLTKADGGKPVFHIIEFQKGGWTVVSADRRANPIMAYSEEGSFSSEDATGGVNVWMKIASASVQNARAKKGTIDPGVARQWQLYEKSTDGTGKDPGAGTNVQQPPCNPNSVNCPASYNLSVGPIISGPSWGQAYGFADASPDRSATGFDCAHCANKALTGCGPLAIAKVMFYYNHQLNNDKPSGYNFTTDYIYSSCGQLNGGEAEIARLIRYAGDNSSTNYNEPQCNTATIDVTSTTIPFSRAGYSNDGNVVDFYNNQSAIYAELSAGRPIILSGTTCGSCLSDYHIWVCHGIRIAATYTAMCTSQYGSAYCDDATSRYFYMDWGQYSRWNGWFGLGDFTMDGGTYNTYLKAHINIRP